MMPRKPSKSAFSAYPFRCGEPEVTGGVYLSKLLQDLETFRYAFAIRAALWTTLEVLFYCCLEFFIQCPVQMFR
jgi:hypothetical protein